MRTENEFTPVIIKCPNCDTVQAAIVEISPMFPLAPWNVYIHDCVHCHYKIMESEWEEISPYEAD
jgi:hypothetical protein